MVMAGSNDVEVILSGYYRAARPDLVRTFTRDGIELKIPFTLYEVDGEWRGRKIKVAMDVAHNSQTPVEEQALTCLRDWVQKYLAGVDGAETIFVS